MPLFLHLIGGATFILFFGSLRIAVDPVLCVKGTVLDFGGGLTSTRMNEASFETGDFNDLDLWLITHPHQDHIDENGLGVISGSGRVFTHSSVYPWLENLGIRDLRILERGENVKIEVDDYVIEVEAIVAIHALDDMVAEAIGFGNGYYVTLTDKKTTENVRIYITGDTMPKEDVFGMLEGKEIDVMIPNCGAAGQSWSYGPLTLNTTLLLQMMDALSPKVVVPVHYDEFSHYEEPREKIEDLHDSRIIFGKRGQKTLIFEQAHSKLKWWYFAIGGGVLVVLVLCSVFVLLIVVMVIVLKCRGEKKVKTRKRDLKEELIPKKDNLETSEEINIL